MKAPDLRALGLSDHMVQETLSGTRRPPIPFEDIAAVLIANRFMCCVCHDPDRPVIIHHINDWAESHDHSRSNLAALCLADRDKAHKRGGLTQNLTPILVPPKRVAFWSYSGQTRSSKTNSEVYMARPSNLASMSVDALLKLRDDIRAVLGRKA
jgi:hypothetical protein